MIGVTEAPGFSILVTMLAPRKDESPTKVLVGRLSPSCLCTWPYRTSSTVHDLQPDDD